MYVDEISVNIFGGFYKNSHKILLNIQTVYFKVPIFMSLQEPRVELKAALVVLLPGLLCDRLGCYFCFLSLKIRITLKHRKVWK